MHRRWPICQPSSNGTVFPKKKSVSGDHFCAISFISAHDIRPVISSAAKRSVSVRSSVDVIATPGHTPGHLAFFFREASLLFAGDYDLTRFGPWYGDLFSSIEQTRASIDLLQKIPAGVVMTGHETGLFVQPSE